MKKLLPALLLLASTHAYSQTDTLIGKNVSSQKDYRALTAKVIADAQTDQQKANAIFNWITTHISFDKELANNPNRKKETAKSVLAKGSATGDGYVILYVEMAKEAGLHAIDVEGYIRSYYLDNGDTQLLPGYDWCVVRMEGKWYIVDPAAGAGYVTGYTPWLTKQFRKLSKEKLQYDTKEHFEFHYNPGFFMVDPIAYRKTRLAAYPKLQLAKTPMPLSVFEAGEKSVDSFNNAHKEVDNESSMLLMLANMTEEEYVQEMADACYAANNRYKSIKGTKLCLSAGRMLNANSGVTEMTEAKSVIKEGVGYFKEQKQLFPDYFSALLKKNDTKHRETQEYVRQVEASNKTLTAKCARYERSSKTKNSSVEKKYEALKKPVKVLQRSADAKVVKKADAPDMRRLADSFAQRKLRVLQMQQEISAVSDSAMIEAQRFAHEYEAITQLTIDCYEKQKDEVVERIYLNDQLDDEIKPILPVVKEMRLATLDTMLNKFFDSFDEMNKRYEDLEKKHDALVDLIALMAKDVAAFKALTNNAQGLSGEYDGVTELYRKSTSDYVNTLSKHMGFNDNMKSMVKNLKEFAEDEKGLTEKITIAENVRHQKEEKHIKEKRSFDEGINKRQQENAAEMINEIDQHISKAK